MRVTIRNANSSKIHRVFARFNLVSKDGHSYKGMALFVLAFRPNLSRKIDKK